jgi:parallel beta-helix repeat protein
MRAKARVGLNAVRVAVLVLAGFCAQSLMAGDVVVGTCLSATNTILTIQDGVNAAAPGATVRLCPGTYPEQVEITRPLTLTGVQSGNLDAAIITSPSGGVQLNTFSFLSTLVLPTGAQLWVHDTKDVTVTNLTVDGTNNAIPNCDILIGIYFQNAFGTVENVATRNQTTAGCGSGSGIWVESAPTGTAGVTFQDNSVQSFDLFGISARGAGTKATINSNSVVGLGSINGGTNGIFMWRGATGTIANNSVIDGLNSSDTPDDLVDASTGIAVQMSKGVIVSGNTVGNTQGGIVLYSADNTTITSNNIFATRVNDGVYVCGNRNSVTNNTITSSDQAGVHLSCAETFPSSTANNNTVNKNTINGACAGILVRSGTSGNSASGNNFFNVINAVKTADTCP